MKTTLIYARPWRKSTGARVDVYLGDGPLADSFGQGGIEWEPAITTRPVISQELMSLALDGKVLPGKATFTVSLNAIQNVVDIKKLDWQGAPVSIWTVDELGYAERTLEITGNIAAARPDLDKDALACTVEADVQLIEKPLLTLAFSGGGGINGDAAKQGVLRPAGFGIVEYVEPVWFDETYNIGQLDGYGNLVSIQKVMEGANDYGAAVANYASYTALRAAIIAKTVPPGRYGTCIAEGLIGFGAPPAGIIGVNCTFGYGLPGTFAQRIVEFHAGVALGSIDTASFTSLTAQIAAVVGGTPDVGRHFTEQRQVRDLLEAICGSCNATPIVTLQGKVAVTRGVASASVATLNRNGSVEPRVINWRSADTVAPVYQLKARTALLGRVLNKDEVFGEDKFTPMGVWNALIGYRLYNTVVGSDGAEWLYINAVPTIGPALPTATYPPAAFATNAYWQQITRPVPLTGSQIGVADGATADMRLVSIGSQAATIVGNAASRAAGSTDMNCCVRAAPILGPQFLEIDLSATALVTLSLDDDATSTAQASMLLHFYYNGSSGAWAIHNNSGSALYSGTTTTGLTGKLRLSYDGIRYRCYINDNKMGSDIAASASNLALWPKWHVYNGPGISYLGMVSGPYTSNVWPDIDGVGLPASYATADLKLTSIGSTSVTIVGNTILRATGNADYNATVRGEPISYGIVAEVDIAAVNALTVVGLDTSATGTAATTVWRILATYNYSTGALTVIRAGVTVLSTTVASTAGKLTLTYDGVRYRVYVGGTEVAITGSYTETAGLSLWPKWSSYTQAVTMTGLRAAAYNNNDWSATGGTGVPASNATADLVLTSIGSQAVAVVGNSFARTAGNADWNACVRGLAITGPQFVEVDIIPGAYITVINIDASATNFGQTQMLVNFYYRASDGAYSLNYNNVTNAGGTTTAGLVGKMRIVYDGIRHRAYINGAQIGTDMVATSPTLTLYGKWHAYNGPNVASTGLRASPYYADALVGQVTVVPPQNVCIQLDSAGAAVAGQLPYTVAAPGLTRLGAAITTSNNVSYALQNIQGIGSTPTIDNTNGSADKGKVTIPSSGFTGGGSFEIVATVDGMALQPIRVNVTTNQASPTAATTKSGSTDCSNTLTSTSYVQIGATIVGLVKATGETIRCYYGGTYNYGFGSGSGYANFKWQISATGAGSWTDLAAAVTGTTAYRNANGDTAAGNVTCNQTTAPANATYDLRLVAARNAAVGNLFLNGETANVLVGV